MHFDTTITLGSILTLVASVGTLIVGLWHFSRRVDKIEWRSEMMWRYFSKRWGTNGGVNDEEKK